MPHEASVPSLIRMCECHQAVLIKIARLSGNLGSNTGLTEKPDYCTKFWRPVHHEGLDRECFVLGC